MEVEGIILAAGLSSRAKTFKLTLAFDGKTVIEKTLESMLQVCSRVIVVGGHRIEELRPIITGCSRALLVYNRDYLQGMYTSVRTGMSYIQGERFFFTPGDYPLIKPEVYRELLKYKAPVVIPTYQGRRGHPVLFDDTIKQQVMQTEGFQSLREVISNNDSLRVAVDCPGILMDLDTIEDYQLLIKQLNKEVEK